MRGQVLNTSTDDWDEGPSLVDSIWRFRWLVVAAALVGAFGAYGLSIRQPPQYEAVGRIFLTAPGQRLVPGGESAPAMDPDRYVSNQAQIMTSAPVISRAAEISGLPPATWRNRLAVAPSKDLDLIVIRVRAGTTSEATKLVDSVAVAYQQVLAKQASDDLAKATERLTATTDKLRAQLDKLNAELQTSPNDPVLKATLEATQAQLRQVVAQGVQVGVTASLGEDAVRFRERAATDGVPVAPRPKRAAAAGGLFALLAGSGLAWWLDRRRRSPSPQADAAAAPRGDTGSLDTATSGGLGLEPGELSSLPGDHTPVLGEIPSFSELEADGQVPAATAPQSAASQAYRHVARLIGIASREAHLATVLVTSPEPGDGKTVTTLNVAIAAAETRERVLVVDGDQRRRGLSYLCQIDGGRGLSDLVKDHGGNQAGECIWLPDLPEIQVVPAGTPVRDGSDLFRTPSFGAAMSRIREFADLILVDSPALSVGPDALDIGKQVDAAIVVVTPESSVGVVRAARQRLDSVGIPVLGYVINGAVAPDQIKLRDNGSSSLARGSMVRPGADTGTG
jgi:Mrp family chromosome partitioning ATPase/capsular polysaccharide biosynthesis protein